MRAAVVFLTAFLAAFLALSAAAARADDDRARRARAALALAADDAPPPKKAAPPIRVVGEPPKTMPAPTYANVFAEVERGREVTLYVGVPMPAAAGPDCYRFDPADVPAVFTPGVWKCRKEGERATCRKEERAAPPPAPAPAPAPAAVNWFATGVFQNAGFIRPAFPGGADCRT